MSLLEIRNLMVEFDTAMGPFRALKGVDYTVETGEVLAIVGESGSGKSVAMLATMGLLPDTCDGQGRSDARLMVEDLQDCQSPQQRRSGDRQGYHDDLSGADCQPQSVFHGGLPDRRGAEDASQSAWSSGPFSPAPSSCSMLWAFPTPEKRLNELPPSDVRWPVPACDDCHGDCLSSRSCSLQTSRPRRST